MKLSQALKGLPHEDVAQGRPLDGQLSLPSCVDPLPGGTTEVSGRAPGPSPQPAETRTYPRADLPCSEPLSRPFHDGELAPSPPRRVYPPPASSPSVGRPASTPGSCLVPGPPPRAQSAVHKLPNWAIHHRRRFNFFCPRRPLCLSPLRRREVRRQPGLSSVHRLSLRKVLFPCLYILHRL